MRIVDIDKQMERQTFRLPYPPSVNHYWGRNRFRNRDFIKPRGVQFRKDVAAVLDSSDAYRVDGEIAIEVIVHFPDRRLRDTDNLHKATYDALTHAGLWGDDSSVARELWEKATENRIDPDKKGWLDVSVFRMKDYVEEKRNAKSRNPRKSQADNLR